MSFALLVSLLSLPSAQAADCGPPTFSFVGQPECVALTFDGARTELVNGCAAPVLVDQSVLVGPEAVAGVPAGERVTLRDLSAFTLGYGGEIHRVGAVVVPAECPEERVEEEREAGPGVRFVRAVLAVISA